MRIMVFGSEGFIGSHIVPFLMSRGHVVYRSDLEIRSELGYHQVNLMNQESIEKVLRETKPELLINLAAVTDNKGKDLDYYKVNFKGVSNIIEALRVIDIKPRIFHFSTQYVIGPQIDNSSKASPVNKYGESKLLGEKVLIDTGDIDWVIFRPTNVWGERHQGFSRGVWRYIAKGLYFHPKGRVMRCYVWIHSLCDQILQFIELSNDAVNKQILYLTDPEIDSYQWVNQFSLNLYGKPVRRVTSRLHLSLAILGECLKLLRLSFVMDIERYRNLTQDYIVEYQSSHKLIKYKEVDFQRAVEQTAKWYLKNVC